MDRVIDNIKKDIDFVKRDIKRQKDVYEKNTADLEKLAEIIRNNEKYIQDCEIAIATISEINESSVYNAIFSEDTDEE